MKSGILYIWAVYDLINKENKNKWFGYDIHTWKFLQGESTNEKG